MKRRVFFRADGNQIIGLGHVIRTLALVSYLKNNYNCVFVINTQNADVLNIIKTECSNIVSISSENDFFSIIDKNDIVVLDGYNFDEKYQVKIKEYCFKLVCIDDICDRNFVCDIIINHGEGIYPNDYSCKPCTKIYLGLKYALLRVPFLIASIAKKREIEVINNYFICFGGSDNDNYTLNTVKQLVEITTVKKINIIVGGGYAYNDELKLFCDSIHSCEINIYGDVNAQEMVSIMLDSHLAIVPSSSISYEVLAVKMPIITGYTVDNQKLIYNSLLQKEVVLGVGTFPITDISEKIDAITNNKNSILAKQDQLFDGKSAERLLIIFNDLCNEKII